MLNRVDSIEDEPEKEGILYKVDGFDVTAYRSTETSGSVTFIYTIKSDTPPIPGENVRISQLFALSPVYDVLDAKGWYDKANDRMLVAADVVRELEISGKGEFEMKITLERR
jgi:hypothetical protein